MNYCPACILQEKLSKVVDLKCTKCKTKYPKSATLLSEDFVRMFIKENPEHKDWLEILK